MQELPIGYQAPNPYEDHPANKMWDKFLNGADSEPCPHYSARLKYWCALCRYEFTYDFIKENDGE